MLSEYPSERAVRASLTRLFATGTRNTNNPARQRQARRRRYRHLLRRHLRGVLLACLPVLALLAIALGLGLHLALLAWIRGGH